MNHWEKGPGTRLIVGRDWTVDLNGQTIVGEPRVEVYGDPSLRLEWIKNEGNVTLFWLSGGNRLLNSQRADIFINTSNNEVLDDSIPIVMTKERSFT